VPIRRVDSLEEPPNPSYLAVERMRLHYQAYGSGLPLIILHGLFGMLDNWHTISRSLGAHFRIYALDQRNHGRSPHSEIFTLDAMAEDVGEFMDQEGISSAFLLGHSMGGKIAMRYALSQPQRVEKLVVVDIAPRSYASQHDGIFEALTSIDLSLLGSREEINTELSKWIPQSDIRQFLMKNLARKDDGTYHWKMNLPIIQSNYQEVLKEIVSTTPFLKPALFIRSIKSSYLLESDRLTILRLFPNSTIVDFGTGHWVHAEAPDLFVSVVKDFLQRAD
jgi:esterase